MEGLVLRLEKAVERLERFEVRSTARQNHIRGSCCLRTRPRTYFINDSRKHFLLPQGNLAAKGSASFAGTSVAAKNAAAPAPDGGTGNFIADYDQLLSTYLKPLITCSNPMSVEVRKRDLIACMVSCFTQ